MHYRLSGPWLRTPLLQEQKMVSGCYYDMENKKQKDFKSNRCDTGGIIHSTHENQYEFMFANLLSTFTSLQVSDMLKRLLHKPL